MYVYVYMCLEETYVYTYRSFICIYMSSGDVCIYIQIFYMCIYVLRSALWSCMYIHTWKCIKIFYMYIYVLRRPAYMYIHSKYIEISYMCIRGKSVKTWRIHTCPMTRSYVRHDAFICVMWLIHMCALTHSNVQHESSKCLFYRALLQKRPIILEMCNATSFICMCGISYSYGWRFFFRKKTRGLWGGYDE